MRPRLGPTRPLVRLVVVALAAAALLAACGDDDEATVAADRDGGDGSAALAATGRVHVRLEPVEGFFVEGFEVGLRFETGAGDEIASTLWSDFVASTGRDDLDAYYDSVLTQEVPAGAVRIVAEANVGMGPGPSIPDLDGPLPCEVEVDVAPGAEVTLEVSFSGGDDCLRVVDPAAPSTSTSTSTTVPDQIEEDAALTDADLVPGVSTYVDVDLECQAFQFGGGTWVLVEGDTSTWQPAGDRHEGGTFTIEAPGRGRFVGDAAETKVAVFERLPEGAEPICTPQPRP